jgi:hypothetical protein
LNAITITEPLTFMFVPARPDVEAKALSGPWLQFYLARGPVCEPRAPARILQALAE